LHPFKEVGRRFNAGYNDIYEFPRYNVRPAQNLPIVISDGKQNELVPATWGLSPAWAKGKLIFNTRDESVATKTYFERLFSGSRCLVPADGFYEWLSKDGKKFPFRFVLKTRDIFGFAGIFEPERNGKQMRFSIITTKPNELVKNIHDRMPVIIPREMEGYYVDPHTPSQKLFHFLKPYPAGLMEAYPVSTLVNSAKNDSPDIIKPI